MLKGYQYFSNNIWNMLKAIISQIVRILVATRISCINELPLPGNMHELTDLVVCRILMNI